MTVGGVAVAAGVYPLLPYLVVSAPAVVGLALRTRTERARARGVVIAPTPSRRAQEAAARRTEVAAQRAARLPMPGEMALDDPTTKAALRTYRRRARWVVLVGMAMVAVFVVAVDRTDASYHALERSGLRLEGRVVDGAGGGKDITVDYVDLGTHRTLHVHLDDDSPDYRIDQPVTVLVDPKDHDHATILGEDNQGTVSVDLMLGSLVGGGMLLIAGVFGLVRARRQRRLLATHPWRRVPIVVERMSTAGLSMANGPRGLLVGTPPDVQVLTFATTFSWRPGRSGIETGALVDVAGDLGKRSVLRAAGSDLLMPARPPRLRSTRRKWFETLTQVEPLPPEQPFDSVPGR